MRVAAAVCCLLSCVGLAGTAAAGSPRQQITVIDLTERYAAFHDRTEAMSAGARVAAFKAEVAPLLPDFYQASQLGGTPEAYDAAIVASFESFSRIRADMPRVVARLRTALDNANASFRLAFPDAGEVAPVYVLHALGALDGGVRTVLGRDALVFGADVLAAAPARDDTPFLHHELFHLYHRRSFSGCQGMWCSLWREGLATYASHALNPGASDADLKLSTLRPVLDARLAEAVCSVRAALDSRNNAPYFSSGSALRGFPPRFGYYVGYLAARQAASERSIADLAKRTATEARPIVERALETLATCPRLDVNVPTRAGSP